MSLKRVPNYYHRKHISIHISILLYNQYASISHDSVSQTLSEQTARQRDQVSLILDGVVRLRSEVSS